MNPYSERPKTNYSLPVALTMSLACILLMVRTGQEVEDKRALQGLLKSREAMLAQGLSEVQHESYEIEELEDREKTVRETQVALLVLVVALPSGLYYALIVWFARDLTHHAPFSCLLPLLHRRH